VDSSGIQSSNELYEQGNENLDFIKEGNFKPGVHSSLKEKGLFENSRGWLVEPAIPWAPPAVHQ